MVIGSKWCLNVVRVVLLGTGEIARKMAHTLNLMKDEGVSAYGVISRSLERAEAFQNEFNIEKTFINFDQVLEDKQVDIVYIASPHNLHYEQAAFFLNHRIPVLCEKPICVNSMDALKLMNLSRENNTPFLDATWSRYMPFSKVIKEKAEDYKLGKLLNIHSSLGIQKQNVQRMIDPNLAGGALLDVGIYPVTFSCMFNNSPIKEIKTMSMMTESGVDQSTNILLMFEDGMIANCQSSMGSVMSEVSTLSYEFGIIECVGIPQVKQAIIKDIDHQVMEVIDFSDQLTGYEFEVRDMIESINTQQIESPTFSHVESLKVMRILDEVRHQIGLKYPFE